MKKSILLVVVLAALFTQPTTQKTDIFQALLSFGKKVVTQIINDSKAKKMSNPSGEEARRTKLSLQLQQQIKNLYSVSQDGALQAVNQAIDKVNQMLELSEAHAVQQLEKVIDSNEARFTDLIDEARSRVQVYNQQSIGEHIRNLGKLTLNYNIKPEILITSAQEYVGGIIKKHIAMFTKEYVAAQRSANHASLDGKAEIEKTQEELRRRSIDTKHDARQAVATLSDQNMRKLKNLSVNSRAQPFEYVSLMNLGIQRMSVAQ